MINLKLLMVVLAACLMVGCDVPAASDAPPTANTKEALPQPIRQLDVEQFSKLAAEPNTVILDVRTAREFQAGHLKGAVLIDIHSRGFEQKIAALDKSKTYLVYCASGVRSKKACGKMAGMDFPKLANLTPGFIGWQRAGQPFEK